MAFWVALAGAAAGTALEAYSVFSKPKAPAAPTQAQTSTQQAESAMAAAQAQATALQQRRGLGASILTSPMGVGGGTQTQRATLGA